MSKLLTIVGVCIVAGSVFFLAGERDVEPLRGAVQVTAMDGFSYTLKEPGRAHALTTHLPPGVTPAAVLPLDMDRQYLLSREGYVLLIDRGEIIWEHVNPDAPAVHLSQNADGDRLLARAANGGFELLDRHGRVLYQGDPAACAFLLPELREVAPLEWDLRFATDGGLRLSRGHEGDSVLFFREPEPGVDAPEIFHSGGGL